MSERCPRRRFRGARLQPLASSPSSTLAAKRARARPLPRRGSRAPRRVLRALPGLRRRSRQVYRTDAAGSPRARSTPIIPRSAWAARAGAAPPSRANAAPSSSTRRVSGGPAGAQAGTLTVMVGGDQGAFDRALPVFRAFGKKHQASAARWSRAGGEAHQPAPVAAAYRAVAAGGGRFGAESASRRPARGARGRTFSRLDR